MGVELYAHNQTAYEAAVQLLRESRRAAVIHPTGTGKSFIAFKLAQEHPQAQVCWLSPSQYIFQTCFPPLTETHAQIQAEIRALN